MKKLDIESPLFLNAFDIKIWKNKEKIEHLQHNITKIEEVIEKYLANITEDFPHLTDHSLQHSRMLWNYANIIVGSKKKFLNPVEAFVLHVVFLIHDSGMCYSILNNKDIIQKDPLYTDFLAEHGTSDDVKEEALFYTVRQRHGDFAEKVATEKLKEDEYLVQDITLREELGSFIGKIAKSHTCNINYIDREFGAKYCDPHFPVDWSIDCQKLAFILRVSDAAHIDNLRTPKTNKMIAKIGGVSQHHWTFQKKLGFPQISDDNLLMYTTNSPFYFNEQKAWWFCYNALEVLDKELKAANEYFDVKAQEGFQAKGVKSINNTLELGNKYIRTEGWKSIDTKIKVSNPVHIASELGGVKLYGAKNIALRELLQNSIDAINLHRVVTGQNNPKVGEIKVSLEKIHEDFILVISDNGIGMSQTLLTNELLDFGGSYWKSNKFNYEYAGLKSKGFESIGKFGIGFFSIFMLGQEVTITSWKFGEGISDMKTLEFYEGLNSNPLLREPTDEEKSTIIDRGTTIKVKLENDPYSQFGLLGEGWHPEFDDGDKSLYSLTKSFIPSPNVKLTTTEIDGTINVITPNYIDSLVYSDLYAYTHPRKRLMFGPSMSEVLRCLPLKLIDITDDDKFHGRLVVPPDGFINQCNAIVISKGIKISNLNSLIGYVITNDVVSIKRDSFTANISYESLRNWAIEQISQIDSGQLKDLYILVRINLLMIFDLFDESLPIAYTKVDNIYNYITIGELRIYLKENNSIKFYTEGHTVSTRPATCEGFIILKKSLSFHAAVKDEDHHKLIDYQELLKQIIGEEWENSEFKEENLMMTKGFSLDMPYLSIDEYKKTAPIH